MSVFCMSFKLYLDNSKNHFLYTKKNLTQGIPAQYNFWDLEKMVLFKIRTSWDFIANFHYVVEFVLVEFVLVEFVLVEFVLVKTVLVGDPLYTLN